MLDHALALLDRICFVLCARLVGLALAIEQVRRTLRKRSTALRTGLRALRRRLRLMMGAQEARPATLSRRRAWNRTSDHVEEKLVRLHVDQPQLGSGQLRFMLARLQAATLSRETVRKILIRRQDLVVAFEQAKRKRPRQIHMTAPRLLWGLDLTLVWICAIIPIWIVGIVDYRGSRIVALERVRWPSTAQVLRVLERAFEREGKPVRVLTDRGPIFRSAEWRGFFAAHQIRHSLTKPAHPWTNGRIERVFRTFKETVFGCVWGVRSLAQVDRLCRDFRQFYNRDRPHSSFGGRTPNEVWSGKRAARVRGSVSYFDGQLSWYALG